MGVWAVNDRILYPRHEAAYQLGISVRTLDQYAKVGEIHPRFVGGKVLYHRSELERFASLLHASFRPHLAMTPLRFAIASPRPDVKRTYTSKLSFMHGVQLLLPPRQSRGLEFLHFLKRRRPEPSREG